MARNGSGTYSPPTNSWNPAINGAAATAADWQAVLNDLASALTQSVSKDGQTAMTGNLPFSGNKATGLGAGSSAGDSLRFEQLFSQGTLTDIASASVVDIGAQLTNFLRVTGTTTITSFGTNYNGPRFLIFQGILTLTHSATLVLPGAANIVTAANDALIVLPISGGWQVVAYTRADGLPAVAIPDASETVKGIIELATVAEAQAGTDTTRAVTAAGLAAATAGSRLVNIVRYTTSGSGTYTKPSNVTKLYIRAGAGGGGGGAGDSSTRGGGGGSGGYAEKLITSPSASYAYTVGAGGTAGSGSNGGVGGSTTVAGITCNGGGGGTYINSGAGGGGGAASGGDLNVAGGYGNIGVGASGMFGGQGGTVVGSAAAAGIFGSGGGGGLSIGNNGGAGGAGFIEIWEFV